MMKIAFYVLLFLVFAAFSTEKIKFDVQLSKPQIREEETVVVQVPKLHLLNLFTNESSVQILRDVETDEIYWEAPNDLIEVEKKEAIKVCLQLEGKERANGLFDCMSGWAPRVAAFPCLRELVFCMSESVSLDKKDNRKQTPIQLASYFDADKAVSRLIERKAKVGAVDDWKWTALHESVAYDSYLACKILLQNGANPNARNKYGETPLILAASHSCPEIITILLHNGARADMREDVGRNTALMMAAYYNRAKNVRLLLQWGANTKSKNKWGQTALQLAGKDCAELINAHDEAHRKVRGVKKFCISL